MSFWATSLFSSSMTSMCVAHETQGSYARTMTSAIRQGAPVSARLQVGKFQVVGTSSEKYWTRPSLTRVRWTSVPRGASFAAQPKDPSPCGISSASTDPEVLSASTASMIPYMVSGNSIWRAICRPMAPLPS